MKFGLFFLGGIRRHDYRFGRHRDLFLGGWHLPLPSWHAGFHWALVDGSAPAGAHPCGLFNIAIFFGKVAAIFSFLFGALDLARFRYDQTHAAGMGFLFRNRPRKHLHYGLHSRLFSRLMNLETKKPGKIFEDNSMYLWIAIHSYSWLCGFQI